MDDLDLSGLTDDQLVALARLVAAEIGRREPAVRSAAESAVLDEAERARVARMAAEAEAARLRDAERARLAAEAAAAVRRRAGVSPAPAAPGWPERKRVALMLREQLGDGWRFSVWRGDGAEQRVYVDELQGDARIVYYVTGNSRHAPASLRAVRCGTINRKALAAALAYAAAACRTATRVEVGEAVEAPVEAAPTPAEYEAAR